MHRVNIRRAGSPENWQKDQAEHHKQQVERRNKICENCQFSEPFKADNYKGTSNLVMCRRYPPVVFSDNGKLATKWPLITSDHWCGEWRAS